MKTQFRILFVGSALLLSFTTAKAQFTGATRAAARAAKVVKPHPNTLTAVGVGAIHTSEHLKQIQKQKTITVPKPNVVTVNPKTIKRKNIKLYTSKVPLIDISKEPRHHRLLQERHKDVEESTIVTSIPDKTTTPDEGEAADKEEGSRKQ